MNTKTNYLFALTAFLLSAFNVSAATCTWVGSSNAAWGNASNWSGNAVPGSSDDVVFNNGSASNMPELYFSTTVNSITMSAGTFTMSGNTLTVNATASFTGGTLRDGTMYASDFVMSNHRFEGLLIFYKNGGGNNDMNGGNVFVGPIAFVNNDDSRWRFGTNSPDDFQGICHFSEDNSGQIEPAYNGDNTFSGDISTNGSVNLVTFGAGNGTAVITGTTTLYGTVDFNRLTVNTTGQINLDNSSIDELRLIAGTIDLNSNTLTVDNAYFTGGNITDGTVNITNIQSMQNATFTGPLTIEKTGGSNNTLAGGNTFNSAVTIINSSNSLFRLANSVGDDYNGVINFRENGSGQLEPAYNGNNTFSGDISTNNTSNPVSFGEGSGIVIIDGSGFQEFVGNAQMPILNKLTINKNGTFYINNLNIFIANTLSFTSGVFLTGVNREIIFGDNATHTGAKNSSHISGPVTKRGNDAFVFPTGDGILYAPIGISAPASTGDAFTAQYFNTPYSNITSLGSGLNNVSSEEHWILDRTSGTSNVNVTMYYHVDRSGGISQQTDLRVSRWNGSQWVSHGNGGTSGTNTNGNVISSAAITDFSPFTLGSSTTLNPLPVQLLNFNAIPLTSSVKVIWSTTSELNNDFFVVEKSIDGKLWNEIGRVEGADNSNSVSKYMLVDNAPVIGLQYYRLKQVDQNGEFTYSHIASARFTEELVDVVTISPNPAKDIFNVMLLNNEDENASVAIINSLGQTVLQFDHIQSSILTIDMKDLSNGVYALQVTQNGLTTSNKLIKN